MELLSESEGDPEFVGWKGERRVEETKKRHKQKKWMYLAGLIAILCVLAGADYYVTYVRRRLMEQNISNVQAVTKQQQQAFDNFINRDRERLHSYALYFSKHNSEDVESIQDKLEVFAGVDAVYTVINLETGEYFNNQSSETYYMSEVELKSYRDFQGRGVQEPYVDLLTNQKMFGYYEVFTFSDGVRGLFQKGYISDRVSEEFTLSFYNDQGFAYLVNQQGDVLLRPHNNGKDDVGDNIFDMFDDDESDREQLEIFKEALNGRETGSGVLYDEKRGRNYVYTYVPVDNVDEWYLVSIVFERAIMDEANQVISNSQAVIVVAITVMAALCMFVFFMWRTRKEILQKELERDYKEQQFRILANYLANNTDDAYLLMKEDKCTIEYASPNFERVMGIRSENAPIDLKILKYEGGELDKLKENEATKPMELERINPQTGERKWLQEVIYCAYIQGERKYIIYISDRTEDREIQNNLKTALDAAKAANQAKSSFLSSVSHDIRTPMNAIIGLIMLLQEEADNPKNVREYAKKIDASSQYLLGLINDVLDMNKVESGNMTLNAEEIDLAEIMERLNSIIRPQVKAKNQSMDIYTSGFRHEHVVGDKTRINQILINILSNAVKYTPKGGRIEMTANELPPISEGFTLIQFVVKDNGQGMSEEYQKVIFEPFTRERNSTINEIQGTGLGMAITKNLVDLMGGTMSVKSKVGEGSTFTVELNLKIQEKEDDQEFWNNHGIKRIIVADDDRDICENVVHALSKKGVVVEYVTDGKEVIPTVRKAREDKRPYDLLLLDWQMPELSGLEVARLLRKNYPVKIPILLFTAYDWTDIEKEAIEVGIEHFMPKPFFISTFKEAVKRVMYKKTSEKAAVTQPEESIVKDKHILVVEDNKVNTFILLKILSSRGATYCVAEDGQKAVNLFNASGEDEYDFILMDVKMPVMDGYEATRTIRAGHHPNARTIPIIAMTANAFADDVADALNAGMNAHVAKPIMLDQLERTIKEVLERKKQ